MSDSRRDRDDRDSAGLSFDPRSDEQKGGRLPLVLIFSVLLLLAVILGIALAYRNGARAPGDAPALVGQPVPELSTQPDPAAQPQTAGSDLQILHDQAEAPAPQTEFAQGPEVPLPREAAPAPVVAVAPRPAPVAVKPQPAPVAAPAPAVVKDPAPQPVVAAEPKPEPKPVAAEPKPSPVASGNSSAVVQIGAFSSEAQVEAGWSAASAAAGSAMSGKTRRVETIQKDGKTLYRTSIAGFASRADATALCDRLKAAGKSCFVK